jgi:hypothetical protein
MSERNDLREKKLRGSGGYAFANITDEEQKKGNLGGPELFLAGVGKMRTGFQNITVTNVRRNMKDLLQ